MELKTGAGSRPLQEAIVAFSNTSGGGTIYIGVADDRSLTGRRLDQGTHDAIHEASLAAKSAGRVTVSQVIVGDTPVVEIVVGERVDDIAQTSDGKVLRRHGGRNVAVFGSDLFHLVTSRSLMRYELVDSGVAVAEAIPVVAEGLARIYHWGDDSATWFDRWREQSLALASGNLTNAGALVLCDPSVVTRAAKFHIDIRSYEQDHTTSYVRRETLTGPIQRQVEMATEWVLRDVGSEFVVTEAYRHDIPRLPRRVVREAVANAVAHRDYSVDKSPTVIEIRPSGVTIRSPGGLVPPVTLQNLREAQAARNHVLIGFLRRYGLAEDSGQGIDAIQDGMQSELLDDPIFTEDGAFFSVVLPLSGVASVYERAWLAEYERTGVVTADARPLILAVHRQGRITNATARNLLGVDSTVTRARLQRLRDAGILVQHGQRGRAYYTLGSIGPGRNIQSIVLEMAQRGWVTNSRVREATGIDAIAARSLLQRLVREGRLKQEGERRGTRYASVDFGIR